MQKTKEAEERKRLFSNNIKRYILARHRDYKHYFAACWRRFIIKGYNRSDYHIYRVVFGVEEGLERLRRQKS